MSSERSTGRPAAGPSFRRLPRAVREQQILDAAVVVFSRQGYHAASVDEIAGAAGISKPMVYAYLGTKEELFIACLHREGLRLMEALAAAANDEHGQDEHGQDGHGQDGRGPDGQLWRGLRAFFGFVGAHRHGWNVLYRQARGREPFADVLAQMRASVVEIVSDMLARAGVSAGIEVRADDVTTMAYALVGAAEALADWVVEHPAEDPDVTATRLMNVAWMGAGALLRGHTWHPPSWSPQSP